MLPVAMAMALTLGCESDRIYECQNDSECRRSGQLGDCLGEGFCAFSDSSCSNTGLRWDSTAGNGLAGQCVDTGGGGDGGTLNSCGGTVALSGVVGQACGLCNSGSFACEGIDALRCDGEVALDQNVTAAGSVSASSIFSGSFDVDLAVDGELDSSWFSAGSITDGTESVFSWIGSAEHCLVSIGFEGNGLHSNTQFREGFGFGQMTVEIRDSSDTVVFSKIESLPGTPDPSRFIDTGGVVGRSVHLRMQGHESNDCGGFAELTINAKQ